MTIVNWNVEWTPLRSERSAEVFDRISQPMPEIACLTETHRRLLRNGHPITSRPEPKVGERWGPVR